LKTVWDAPDNDPDGAHALPGYNVDVFNPDNAPEGHSSQRAAGTERAMHLLTHALPACPQTVMLAVRAVDADTRPSGSGDATGPFALRRPKVPPAAPPSVRFTVGQ